MFIGFLKVKNFPLVIEENVSTLHVYSCWVIVAKQLHNFRIYHRKS